MSLKRLRGQWIEPTPKPKPTYLLAWTLPLLLATGLAAAGADQRLADAVEDGDDETARTLVQEGVAVNEAQPDGTTALHWAVQRDEADLTTLLLEAGANANATNRYGVSPLSVASTNGNVAIVTALLDAGANPNAATPYGQTPLMTAARAGDADVVTRLLAAGANPNARESVRRQTALMWAAAGMNAAAARMLIEGGADVAARSEAGMTPLVFAAREGDLATVQALLTGGANINEAAEDAIPRRPRDPKVGDGPAPPRLGSSALATAIRNAHYELAAWLVEQGADPNLDGPRGTALHGLVRARNCELTAMPCPTPTGALDTLSLAKVLLAHGADVNARMTARPPTKGTYDGNAMSLVGATPFFLAVKAADITLMRLFLEHGADQTLGNSDDTPPLFVAAGLGFIEGQVHATEDEALEAVEILVGLGEDVTATNARDETALHGAAYRGANSIVRYLVDRGADLWAKDDKDLLPVTIADGFRRGTGFRAHDETAALLRELMGPDAPERNTDQGAR